MLLTTIGNSTSFLKNLVYLKTSGAGCKLAIGPIGNNPLKVPPKDGCLERSTIPSLSDLKEKNN